METVPCPVVGITGSAGKTTTTMLVGEMARMAYGSNAHVGGNIGDPLLNYVDGMQPGDLAILEISSFQLEQMQLSPQVAAVLNITPNHLDRHGSMEAYISIKQRILDFQHSQDQAVLCRDDAGSWSLGKSVHGRLLSFGFSPLPAGQDGAYLEENTLHLRIQNVETPLLNREQIQLRGDHNVMNLLAAFVIGRAAGLPLKAMLAAAKRFRGVAHRLEFVREVAGVKWYNDSIATAPERTVAAIRSFDEPIVLLLGGRDKDLPWDDLVALCRQRVDHVILFGEAAQKIGRAFGSLLPGQRLQTLETCRGLQDAVCVASRVASSGDIVLLAPGGTSFDEFRDFEERGESFRKWVSELL
jgi:UDP-N-acetylmuramoylalanine--D-glutamate ligase